MSIFEFMYPRYKITKPIRLIELFGGIGSQAKALKNIGANFEHYKLVEYDKYPVASYNAIHNTNFTPLDITKIHASDLGIKERDKYEYIMTYSFPCQDLSLAGLGKGMKKGSGTRSGLLWEVERLLIELGTFIIRAFKTQHDAAEPVGYYLYSTFTKERLLFATDTYYIENRFDNLNYIMLECNYKREYLDQNTNLPKSARIRLLKSHFELSNVVNFLKANDLSKVKEIYLMHLSAGNSNANEFKRTVQEATGLPTYICNE